MGFWSDYGKGVSTHVQAWSFIAKHRLWGYFLYPFVLLLVLSMLGFFSVYNLSSQITDTLFSYVTPDHIDTGYKWLDATLFVILKIVKFIAGFIIRLYILAFVLRIARYVVLILCSPMMALLSERIEEIRTGHKFVFEAGQFFKDVLRGILINLRNLFLELSIMLACCVIGWIPVVGWLTIPFLWLVGWYFLGFNMMDYSCERRRMNVSQGAAFIRKRKGIAIGNGMIFSFLLMIPWLGLIVAPVLSCTAGTLATLDAFEEKK